jgi:hypothetical protein
VFFNTLSQKQTFELSWSDAAENVTGRLGDTGSLSTKFW